MSYNILMLLVFNISYAISTLSIKERQLIAASVKRLDNEYNCEGKKKAMRDKLNIYISRKAPKHIIDTMKSQIDTEAKNMCDSSSKRIVVDNTIYKKCLCNYRVNNFSYLYDLYKAYEKGYLPFKGAYTEQPNKAIEIIRYIDLIYTEMLDEVNRRVRNAK